MSQTENAIEYARTHKGQFLNEFKELVGIPSVSTLSEHRADMQRAAQWVANQMRAIGLENVAVMPTAGDVSSRTPRHPNNLRDDTSGHPVVYGEWLHAPGKPTLLVYGHYDVQPAEPLDEWTSPPFEATVRGDNLYGRGASDMKSNLHETLKALESLERTGGLPLNVKLLIEGEEEIGSKNLGPFIDQHAELLKADLCLNADSGILAENVPSMVYGLRGLAYLELWVYGPAQDLHSGIFGGAVHNPAQVLCELIAGMHDTQGRVTLPRFYDDVHELSAEERADFGRVPTTEEDWKKLAGVSGLFGETGYTSNERTGARPTLEINGLYSGFTGEGAKTVLPAKAMAKISMRLVPYQNNREIEVMLNEYVAQHAPPTVRWQVKRVTESGPGVMLDRNSPGAQAASAALRETFGVEPIFIASGGSVPIVPMLKEKLGVDSVLLGFGLPDDGIHGPNEKQYLPNYYRGIETYIRFFEKIADVKSEA